MENHNIKISKIFDFAWKAFLLNWRFYVPVFFVLFVVGTIVGWQGEEGGNKSLVFAIEILWSIIQLFVVIGVINSTLQLARGDRVSWSDFWLPEKFLPILGTAIVFSIPFVLLIGVLFAAFYFITGQSLPALLIASSVSDSVFMNYGLKVIGLFMVLFFVSVWYVIRMYFYQYVVVDQKRWGISALRESYRITKGKMIPLLTLMFALIFANLIGVFTFGIGLLVSLPFTFISIAYAYISLYNDNHGVQSNLPVETHLTLPSE